MSARQGNIVIVEALLVQSASIDITTGEGWTPIMFASTNNHVEVGKILLEHGASVSISDKASIICVLGKLEFFQWMYVSV